MPPSNVAWGIEIGSGAIKGVKLVADGDDVQLVDTAIVPHTKVLSTPDLDQDDALRVALGQLAANHDLSGAAIAISIPGHQSFARFAKLPPVEPKKVPDIVKFEAVQQVPFPLEDVEWDYQTFVSPDSPDIEVGIFAVTRQRIMEKLELLQDVGITPDLATISPVAAYNALAFDLGFTEDTPGTIILDIGTTATDMIVAEKGRVWTSAFPIGGHQFTDALVTAFKLSYSKAEKLKKEAEQTKHARHAFQAMRPVFTDLVQELQRRIGSYTSSHPGADLKRLIGLGSTFQLPGLRKYLKQQLQMDVYRLEELRRVKAEDQAMEAVNKRAMELGTAYGLALQCLGMSTLEANLMPAKVVRDAMWKRKRAWFGMAAGVGAAASAAFFVRPLLDSFALSNADRPANINSVVSSASRLTQRAQDMGVASGAPADFRAAEMIELFDGRDVMPTLVADVGSMLSAMREAAIKGDPDAVVELVSLETEYVGAGGGAAGGATGFGGGGAYGGGSPYGGQPAYGSPAPAPAAAPADPSTGAESGTPAIDLSTTAHVRVNMQLRYTASSGQKAAREALDIWAEKELTREGAAYRFAKPADWLTSETIEQESSTPGGRPGGRPGGGRGGDRDRPDGRPGDRPGDRPDGRPGQPRGESDVNEAQLIRNMEKLAPIVDPSAEMAIEGEIIIINLNFGIVPGGADADAGLGNGGGA